MLTSWLLSLWNYLYLIIDRRPVFSLFHHFHFPCYRHLFKGKHRKKKTNCKNVACNGLRTKCWRRALVIYSKYACWTTSIFTNMQYIQTNIYFHILQISLRHLRPFITCLVCQPHESIQFIRFAGRLHTYIHSYLYVVECSNVVTGLLLMHPYFIRKKSVPVACTYAV